MVMRVLNKITQKGNIEGNYWDKLVCSILFEKGYNFIITKISYIESLKHNNTLNSTKFLEEEKIKFLKNKWLSFL